MIVYLVTNKVNNKIYIGQTVKTLIKRKQSHLSDAGRGSKLPIHCAIRKYGEESFLWEEIYHTDNLQDLNAAEEYLIAEYDSRVKGYNIAYGGGNRTQSLETRKKISEGQKGEKNHMFGKTGEKNPFFGKNHSKETREKWSKERKGKNTGENHPNFGKEWSAEHRKKISEGQKGEKNHNFGKPMSEEQRKKLSEAHKGKIISKETRKKLSIAMTGEKHPMYGRTGAKSHMYGRTGEKSSNFDRKIYAFRHAEYGLAFCTKYILGEEFGVKNLSSVFNGKRKHTNGWSLATPEYIQTLRETTSERICNQ